MRTKRFLAFLLVLLMVVSLFPAAALAEGSDDEPLVEDVPPAEEAPETETEAEEELEPLPEDPEDGEIEALVPEEDVAEPEADPVLYDLWVCGVQVTSANKQSIDGGYMVRFDSDTNTLTIYTNTFFKNNSTQLHEGALIYSALPNLTVNLQLNTDNQSNYISSDAAQSLIYVENGSLTIMTKDGTTPQLKSNSAAVGIDVHGGSFTLNGNLSVNLGGDTADACIFAESGLTSTGTLSLNCYECTNGFGIKVMNGPITINGDVSAYVNHCGIYCGNGDVNVTGYSDFGCYNSGSNTLCPTSGLYVANGDATVGEVYMFGGADWVVYASGSVHVTKDLNFENTANPMGGNGIKGEHGGIVIDGSATITAINCLDAGDSTDGILVKGDLTLTPSGRHGAIASNGPITVQGNMDVRGAREVAVLAKGDITVEGNAYVSASNYGYSTSAGIPMQSTEGSINVTGNLDCYGTKNPVYAKNDVRIGGNALTSAAAGTTAVPGDFGIKAENGEITIGGTLTCKGKAAYSVWAGTSVTVEKDVTITNAAEGSVGMYANGFLNFVSGKWDVTAATAALQAGNGIEIPEGFGVTLPARGIVATVDSLNTVTESDGATVAAHAIIEAKEYTEGYYLIGPDWTLTGIVPTDKFEVNPDNANEYILNTTLSVGDQIKVVKLTDGAITEWYPDGVGTQYTVDQAHAGTVTIYFKTTYDSAWSEFGGFFYIEHVHDWSKPTWTWTETEDGYTATATFVCENDASHTKTVNATITSETVGRETIYTATVELDGQTYTDTKTVASPAVTVIFNAGEGTVDPATKEVNAGEAIGELPVPTREGGWVFMGWYTTPAATPFDICQGTEVTAETLIEEDTTVFAHWRLPGDVNGDGKVNAMDVSLLTTYVKARSSGITIVPFSGDVNGDGKVNSTDVSLLTTYVKARGNGVVLH